MAAGYRENLNIIFMRDNGPRRSIRMRRSHYFALVAFFCCLPFFCILLLAQCWFLWQENDKLRRGMESIELECQNAQATVERLQNLEELLREENTPGREMVLRQLADSEKKNTPEEPQTEVDEKQSAAEMAEGPGHEEFPVLDTGRVKVGNVQARAIRGNSLRIALDLRNPDNETVLSGAIEATLLTSSGERLPLRFERHDAGSFRINRFKRAVMNSHIPRGASLENSEVILEVKDQDGKPIYRNVFAVLR